MPKTKEQFEKIKEERRKEILDAALYLFAVDGYDAVTSDSITRKVGCSHGLLYHYFKSKEELFEYIVLEVVVSNYHEIVKDVNKEQNPKNFMRDLLNAYLESLKMHDIKYACSLYLLFNIHLQKKLYLKLQEASANGKRRPFQIFHEKLQEGVASGEFYNGDATEMAIALSACLKGLSYTKIHLGDEFECPSVDILMRMIAKD